MTAIKWSLRLQMIFAMMEKSTFDKNGIKRHEEASGFLALISFQYLWYTDRFFWGKTKLRSIPYPWPRHFLNKANTLSVAVFKLTSMVFSYFLTSKSRIRPVYSKTRKHMKPNHISNILVNTVRSRSLQ